MKRILVVSSMILTATLLIGAAAPALAAEGCQVSTQVRIGLTGRLVTLPDAPTFTARGEGELCYTIEGESARVIAESIPRLTFEAERPPADLPALTVLVEAMPGTSPVVSWRSWPVVQLSGADLRVRAYEVAAAQVAAAKPIVDIILPQVALSTASVSVEGEESQGYVDGDALEALLVGKAMLPEDDFEPYAQALAGQPVLIELFVQMRNPYGKEGGMEKGERCQAGKKPGAPEGEGKSADDRCDFEGKPPAEEPEPQPEPQPGVGPQPLPLKPIVVAPIVYGTGLTLQRASAMEASSSQ